MEKPKTAFILSLVGGIMILLVGFLEILRRYIRDVNPGLFVGAGFLGVAWGTSIIIGSVMLYTRPEQHTRWSIMVLAFSFLSWVGTLGGLFIGFILGLAGGILGITWKPSAIQPVQTSPSTSPIRICPDCGTIIYTDAKYCPKCGKELA